MGDRSGVDELRTATGFDGWVTASTFGTSPAPLASRSIADTGSARQPMSAVSAAPAVSGEFATHLVGLLPTTTAIIVTAPYAQPVLAGRRAGDGFPRT